MSWCMVGTPVNQVGSTSFSQPKNFETLYPGEHETWPPAESGARIAGDEPMDVEERHDVEAAILRRESERVADVAGRGADV